MLEEKKTISSEQQNLNGSSPSSKGNDNKYFPSKYQRPSSTSNKIIQTNPTIKKNVNICWKNRFILMDSECHNCNYFLYFFEATD